MAYIPILFLQVRSARGFITLSPTLLSASSVSYPAEGVDTLTFQYVNYEVLSVTSYRTRVWARKV